jgi:hypothetical protein
MTDGPESEEEMMPGIIALRCSGPNHTSPTEALHHETNDDVRERTVPYEGMAVISGDEDLSEMLGPVSAPTKAPATEEVVQTSERFHDALKRLPLTLGS